MNSHKNAPLTPEGRYRMVTRVQAGESMTSVAADLQISRQTVSKWFHRFLTEGVIGLRDRSSRPHRSHPRSLPSSTTRKIVPLRLKRRTGRQIAQRLKISPASVSRYLRAAGLSRWSDLDPPPPVQRYERRQPGSLIHMDIKKFARFQRPGHRVTGNRRINSDGSGWEFMHVCIDDHSRIGYAEVLADERKETVLGFWKRACNYYASLGVEIRELMTDNGPAYRSKLLRRSLEATGIRHRFTRPYTPRTNGKAERFIQTLMREWAYARSYRSSVERERYLNTFLHDYNWHRPHAGISYAAPVSRLCLSDNNLLRLHT